MKAIIRIDELLQDWRPPFRKERKTKELVVKEGEAFDEVYGNKVFRLVSLYGNTAKIEFTKDFVVKEGNLQDGFLLLRVGEKAKLSFLWGNNGITKTLHLRAIEL
ncbi:MAG: hypothetical protein J7L14_01035 [Candidatus Diapherotrites archaeon]|nr:hypothetical protein [Candidatus Diapherotrites archaeon]